MLRKLDIYLLRHFLTALFVVIVAIGLTIIAINAVEELRDFIDHRVPLLKVLEYYAYFGGWVIKSFFPMFVLLAILFSVAALSRRNEILAIKASGLSLYRIAAPFFLVSLLLAAGHFYYSEFVYPPANKRRLEIKEYTIEKRSRTMHTRVTNIYRQIKPGYFYTIASFNVDRAQGTDLRVYRTGGSRLKEIITASAVEFRDHLWYAEEGVVRTFDTGGESYTEFASMILPDIKETPDDFRRRIGKPEDMGYAELERYIQLMKRTGGPHVREGIDLEIKLSYPLASCVVVLLCIPFAANMRRGGAAVSFAAGILTSLVYFVLFRILQSAGYNEKIPKELAAWGVNGLFLVVGIVSMLKARK